MPFRLHDERRQYVRHHIRVPLQVRLNDGSPEFVSRTGDLSEAGLSFLSPRPLEKGTLLEIDIPVSVRRFKMPGMVRGCSEVEGGFRIGLSFEETGSLFRMKLAEQVLRIAELQKEMARERGEEVTYTEAAEAWVEKFA